MERAVCKAVVGGIHVRPPNNWYIVCESKRVEKEKDFDGMNLYFHHNKWNEMVGFDNFFTEEEAKKQCIIANCLLFDVGDRIILTTHSGDEIWYNEEGVVTRVNAELNIISIVLDNKKFCTAEYGFEYGNLEILTSKKGFVVDCLTGEVCGVLQQKAFDCGIKFCGGSTTVQEHCRCLYLDKEVMTQSHSSYSGLDGEYDTISIEEFVNKCEEYKKANREEKFTIDEYDAILYPDGCIAVGCTKLSKENITYIIKEYKKTTTLKVDNGEYEEYITFHRNGDVEVNENRISYDDVQDIISKYQAYNADF